MMQELDPISKFGAKFVGYSIGTVIFFALIGVPLIVYRAWVASWIWLWFAVPIFHLPELTLIQTIGICLVLGQFRGQNPSPKEPDYKAFWINILTAPLVALIIGYFLKGYV